MVDVQLVGPPPLFPQSIYPVFFPVFLVTDTHHFFLSRVCWAKTIFFPSFKPEALVPRPPIPHWSLITWRHCVSGQSTQASTEQDELSQRLARLRQVWERGGTACWSARIMRLAARYLAYETLLRYAGSQCGNLCSILHWIIIIGFR